MCFNQTGEIPTLNGSSIKLVDKFTNLGSIVPSTETDRHRHANSKGMDSYQSAIGRMEVRPDR